MLWAGALAWSCHVATVIAQRRRFAILVPRYWTVLCQAAHSRVPGTTAHPHFPGAPRLYARSAGLSTSPLRATLGRTAYYSTVSGICRTPVLGNTAVSRALEAPYHRSVRPRADELQPAAFFPAPGTRCSERSELHGRREAHRSRPNGDTHRTPGEGDRRAQPPSHERLCAWAHRRSFAMYRPLLVARLEAPECGVFWRGTRVTDDAR